MDNIWMKEWISLFPYIAKTDFSVGLTERVQVEAKAYCTPTPFTFQNYTCHNKCKKSKVQEFEMKHFRKRFPSQQNKNGTLTIK